MPGYPPPAGGFGYHGPGGAAPSAFPLWYLGAQIVDPNTPSAPLGATKVQGYNPESDYNILMKLAVSGVSDEVKGNFAFRFLCFGSPMRLLKRLVFFFLSFFQ